MKFAKTILPILIAAITVAFAAQFASAATFKTIAQWDIDSTFDGTSIDTQPGWTSFDATLGDSSPPVTAGGIAFSVGSVDGSRNRAGGNDLTKDFVFDDGAGQALVGFLGSAGSLPVGTYEVKLWSWDNDATIGNQIVGYRTNTVETIVSSTVVDSQVNPAITFTFTSDGVSAYDVFVRENNANNRTRLNAVQLSVLVPEPGTFALASFGVVGLVALRRRRRVRV